jgi:hypothetical protein
MGSRVCPVVIAWQCRRPCEGTQQSNPVLTKGFLDASWSWSAQHQNPVEGDAAVVIVEYALAPNS